MIGGEALKCFALPERRLRILPPSKHFAGAEFVRRPVCSPDAERPQGDIPLRPGFLNYIGYLNSTVPVTVLFAVLTSPATVETTAVNV